MSPVDHHSLQRSLRRLSLGTIRDLQRAQARQADIALQEVELQFQVPIQGTATATIVWEAKDLDFDFYFWPAVGQRKDADFDTPMFSYGVIIDVADQLDVAPAVVTACVDYKQGEASQIVGAIVHVGLFTPSLDPVAFSGVLHLTFQGYGATSDEPDPI